MTPGTCRTSSCPRYGLDLKECTCADNKHWGAFESKPKEPGQSLSVFGFAVSLEIIFAVVILINDLFNLVGAPVDNPSLNITSIAISIIAAAIGGLATGAAIAWLYNKFKK